MPRKRNQAEASASKGASSSKAPADPSARRSSRRSTLSQTAPASTAPAPDHEPDGPPSPLPWRFANEDDDTRYLTVVKRPIFPCKYLDDDALLHLELAAQVEQYISNIEWREVLGKKLPSFKEITREFICSFSTHASHRHSPTAETIFFQCMGARRKLSLEEVRIIFGFPEAERWFVPAFDLDEAWNLLTGQPKWIHGFAKSSALIDPALRYIHRILVHSILGRAISAGGVTKVDVYVLWCMATVRPLDGSLFLIHHIAKVAAHMASGIRLGGVITAFAQCFGFDPAEAPQCTIIKGRSLVDLDTLEHMKMIKKQGDAYYLIGPDGLLVPKSLDVPPQGFQPEAGASSSQAGMVDLDRASMEPLVWDILQKKQWVSCGADGSVHLDTERPPNVPVRHGYRADRYPVTPLEGSTFLMAKKMDRLAINLQGFSDSSAQYMKAHEQRHQDLRNDVHGFFNVVNQNVRQLALDVNQRFDWMSQQLNIAARPPPMQPPAPSPPPQAVDTDTETDPDA